VITLHLIMTKRDDISAEDFKAYYLKRHIPLIAQLVESLPVAYKQYFTNPDDELLVRLVEGRGDPRVRDISVVTELSFATRQDAEQMVDNMLKPDTLRQVLADESNFIAPGGIRWVLTDR
jgi:hypothetical protein